MGLDYDIPVVPLAPLTPTRDDGLRMVVPSSSHTIVYISQGLSPPKVSGSWAWQADLQSKFGLVSDSKLVCLCSV